MKLEISIPVELGAAADSLAVRLGVSLSELYAAALAEYITKHSDDDITERLNHLYATEASTLEPPLRRAQACSLSEETGRRPRLGVVHPWRRCRSSSPSHC